MTYTLHITLYTNTKLSKFTGMPLKQRKLNVSNKIKVISPLAGSEAGQLAIYEVRSPSPGASISHISLSQPLRVSFYF